MTASVFAPPRTMTPPRRAVPPELLWAIGISVVLHVVVVAATWRSGIDSGSAPQETPPLRAVIAVPDITAPLETLPVPVPLALESRHREPLATLTLPEIAATPSPIAPPEPAPGSGNLGIGKATGVVLRDRSRLGELYDRTLREFPVEIGKRPRMTAAIVARYPPAALAAGREDSVIAWVVVNEQGEASEIEFPEGTDEFAEEVRAALRTARFKPAEDRLRPIRFPLALQFDFRLSGGDGAAAQAK